MKDNVFEEGPLDALNAFQPIRAGRLAEPAYASASGVHATPDAFVNPDEDHVSFYRGVGKRVLDIVFVIMSLPVTLPVTLLCALALWIEGGQPFYRQQRLGEGGRRFSIVKLRTMHRNADQVLETILEQDPELRAEWNNTQKLKEDPRITRIGGILRKTSLDELPQFWNVLKGEMSVVGPRPMLPDQLALYDDPEPYFALRPGITGQWQVSDRNENSFAHRSTVDASYNNKLSLPLDLSILFQTVGVVLRRTGY